MTDGVILTLAALVVLILLIALIKVLGNAIKALIIALVAGGLLYALLPKLEHHDGAIGDVARKALEVTDDIEGSVQGLRDQASDATRQVTDGLDQMQEAAEAVERSKRSEAPSLTADSKESASPATRHGK